MSPPTNLQPVSWEGAVEKVRQQHLRDLIDVDLIDESWTKRLPPSLAERLQQLLDNPDG